MLQPFERFSLQHLNTLLKMDISYLVTQSYYRGFDHFNDKEKINILITDYKDLGLAKIHFNAVRTDQYAALINLKNEKHVNKVKEMLEEISKYQLFLQVPVKLTIEDRLILCSVRRLKLTTKRRTMLTT